MAITTIKGKKMDITDLKEMLTYKRPSGSVEEIEFIDKFIKFNCETHEDYYGNVYVFVGESDVLFSCHTDTIHNTSGIQTLCEDTEFSLFSKNDGDVLGADNTVGVWIMLNLIEHNIPGVYVFHKNEEKGGLGSKWISIFNTSLLSKINKAIAFDRRGQNEVITHQYNGRCCSDTFADTLAKSIGLGYTKSDNGIFTDTANYISHVAECTNISVGYENEHTPYEYLDYDFLCNKLMPSLLKINYNELPVERIPEDGILLEDDEYYRQLENSFDEDMNEYIN